MKTYKIIRGEKVVAKRKAENAIEAVKKYCEMMPFGNCLFSGKLKQIDAETRGKKWAIFENYSAESVIQK